MTKILMVCLGNICRSPMAQAVLLHHVNRLHPSRLATPVAVESAGTQAGLLGQPPDPRARAALARRGYALPGDLSRRISEADFERFDLILAMDRDNIKQLLRRCPDEHASKIQLFLDFATDLAEDEIPDPYYGSAQGFERVLDLCEAGAKGLVAAIEGGAVAGSLSARS
ncbi:MAG: low molecular weight protein-tyrosine-phosphatase [Burkholderiales bacterium]